MKKDLNNQELKEAIIKGDRSAFDQFYIQTRPEFIGWAYKQFQLEEIAAVELFQQSMLKLYENIVAKKLEDIQANLRTYFYGIAKNIQLNVIRNLKVRQKHQEAVSLHVENLAKTEADNDENGVRKLVKQVFPELKEACQEILRLFYFENKKGKEIAKELSYNNEQVVRTQKSRCLKYLKNLVLEKLKPTKNG